MRDLVAGCVAACLEGEGVLDLNHMEEALGSSSHLFMALHCHLELVCVPPSCTYQPPLLSCGPHVQGASAAGQQQPCTFALCAACA